MGAIFTPVVIAQNNTPRLTVMVEALNVRSGPGLSYPVTGLLKQDDAVDVIGQHPASGWWQIQLPDGGEGWVTGVSTYARVSGDTANVPEVAAPLAAAVMETTPAAPLPPGPGDGTIVFQASSGGPIYAIDAAGSNLRYLTTGLDPALSPDGRWVAFTRWDSPGFGALGSVWVIKVDGSGERPILSGIAGNPKSPTWSPDGRQLAFNMQLAGGHGEELRLCGKSSVPAGAYDIKWIVSDDGRGSFCYTLPPESFWGLRVVDVTTGAFRDLPHDAHAFSPAWDPANDWRLVFDSERGLTSLDINQGTAWPLTADALDHSPVFSPDGQRLAVTYLQHNHWDIHVLNTDGSGRIRLTETPLISIVEQRLRGEEPRIWNNVSATWSPDGSQIAFLSDRSGQWDIWVMNADGSNQRPLFPAGTLAGIDFQYNDVDERMISWER
ncbi:MAG: PD40 domain-containing protein [Anaerolineae bacterium]|nr:PD40 domain-containing protein [Anaerolineae bacterium]